MVEVPDVVGLALSHAEQAFWSAGFTTLFEMYAHSDTVPQGHVIIQEPAGGELVPINSCPEIVISLGPDTGETTVEVPDVVGMSESDAASAINSAGLSVGTTSYQYDDTVPDGCVINQDPGAGTEVNPGTEVDLVISMGPEPGDVPPVPVPPAPVPPVPVEPDASCLLAHWKLDDGEGAVAVDSSGRGNDGTIHNADAGGLGDGGSVWFNDPERGMVISFNGDDSGAYVSTPGKIIPAMSLDNDFTWAFWDKQHADQATNNDVILGNRYGGTESPLQFIKFTPTRFEFFNDDYSYLEVINYDPVPGDEWVHHVVVKDGTSLTYYRNGEEAGTNTITKTIDENPLYMGGDVTAEHWRGYMSDVRIYDCALDENQIKSLISAPPSLNTLSEALDTSLSFNTGGSADWFSQTETFYHDGDSAQSGDISGNQESWMQTTVSGKGTVKFYWMVSSEEKYDCLEFYIDGVLQEKISGFFEDYWEQKTYTISTSGSHTLEWRYIKDGITDYGSDCGRVDKVEWVSTP